MDKMIRAFRAAQVFGLRIEQRAGFAARKKVMERALARRQALESMRAALDEDTVVLRGNRKDDT